MRAYIYKARDRVLAWEGVGILTGAFLVPEGVYMSKVVRLEEYYRIEPSFAQIGRGVAELGGLDRRRGPNL